MQRYLNDVANKYDLQYRQQEGRWILKSRARIRPFGPSDRPPDGGGDSPLTQAVKDAQTEGQVHWAGFETVASRTAATGNQAVLARDTLLETPQTSGMTLGSIVDATHTSAGNPLRQAAESDWVPQTHTASLSVLEGHLAKFKEFEEGDEGIADEWKRVEELWNNGFPHGTVSYKYLDPRVTVRYKSLTARYRLDRVMPFNVIDGHEDLHSLHAATGAVASTTHPSTLVPDRVAHGNTPVAVLSRLYRWITGSDTRFEWVKVPEKCEEIFTGSYKRSRAAALKVVPGAKNLVLRDGSQGILTWEEIYGTHRLRGLMVDLHSELHRLKETSLWAGTFGRQNDPAGNDALEQFRFQMEVLEGAARTTEGELAKGSMLRGPVRHSYSQASKEKVVLDERIDVHELEYEHYRPRKGTFGTGKFASGYSGKVFKPYAVKLMPFSLSGPTPYSVMPQQEAVSGMEEVDCDLSQEAAVETIDANDPDLSADAKRDLAVWRPVWEEVEGDAALAAGEITVTGREMSGLPGGQGVWSQAGNVLPGTSVLRQGKLGAATGEVHRQLTVDGKGEEARLEEYRRKFGPGGEGVTAEMTLAVLQAPGLLEDAFRKGTPPLKLDQDIATAGWSESRKTLYNDWLYGTPGTATDAQRRRAYCHLSVCLYRQTRDAAGSSLQKLLDGLDEPLADLPDEHKWETPRDGLEECYKTQLRIIEHLAETITGITKSKSRKSAEDNMVTWLEVARADFKAGIRRMHEVAGNSKNDKSIPPYGTAAYSQWARFGKYVYQDLFIYQPLNPEAASSLSEGKEKALDRAKQRDGLDYRLTEGFERDWSVLTRGDKPFSGVDLFLPVSGKLSPYHVFSRAPGSTHLGYYREIFSRVDTETAPVQGEPEFVDDPNGATEFASSMERSDVVNGRFLFFKSPPSHSFKYASVSENRIFSPSARSEFGEKHFSGLRLHGGTEISLSTVDAVMPDRVNNRFWFFEGNRYVHAEVSDEGKCKRLGAGRITADTWPALFGKSPDGDNTDNYDRIDEVIPVPVSGYYVVCKGASYRIITIPEGGGKSELVGGPYSGFMPIDLIVALRASLLPRFAAFHEGGSRIFTLSGHRTLGLKTGTTDIDNTSWPSLITGSYSFYVVDAAAPTEIEGSKKYYIFSGTRYRRIKLGQNSPEVGSTLISEGWPSLSQGGSPPFTSVDAVIPVPGVAKEFYFFSGEYFRRIRLEGAKDTLVTGPRKLNERVLWPELWFAGFDHIDAFAPVPDRPHTYHVFSGDRTVQVGFEPDTTADLIGLHCWELQSSLLAAVEKTKILDRQIDAQDYPAKKVALKNYYAGGSRGRAVVEDIRGALRTLWDPGMWSFRTSDFGKSDGGIDREKVKFELEKYFPDSVRVALLTPAVSGELPFQLAKDAKDVLEAGDKEEERYPVRRDSATAAVGRLEAALKDWLAAVKDVLAAGAAADQHYDDAREEKWEEEEWATARVQEWSDFHTKLSAAWAYVEKTDGNLGPGIFAAADRLADPDAGALATALGTRLQDTLVHIYRQSADIRAKRP
ncbi:hypothetical protein [Streptomyces sp. x-19]|uniref:hypothetical protein n=1 Tax=Streptomyces sp. x-19 TaxID=2789280 RepID=UPI00397ED2A9